MGGGDRSGGGKKRRSFARFLLTLIAIALAALLVAGGMAGLLAFAVYDHVTQPGVPGAELAVAVPEGTTGRDVGRILADHGLIEHELFFWLALKLEPAPKAIRHGEYTLRRGWSARQLLEKLQSGPDRMILENQFKVTIPEGLGIAQAAALTPDPEGFAAAARDPELVARAGVNAPSLEGFLMPNTYYFDKPPAGRELVERMLAQFQKEYQKCLAEVPGAEKLDKLRVVTVASIVEEETRADEERPKVARVIYNRLDKGMRLQMDSTLQYALQKYGQRMLETDLQTDSPYNTYLNTGLPPGPICSPGAASLRAALRPETGKWIFFVSNADGRTHTFSVTEEEHLKAVARFRREIAPQRRALREQQGTAP